MWIIFVQCAVVCYYEAHRHQLQLLKSLLMMTHGGGNNGGNGTESAVGAQIRDLTLREFLANKHFFGCLFGIFYFIRFFLHF